MRTLSLQFSGDRDRANAALEFLGRKWNLPLGLRGRPMISTSTPTGTPAAISGRWVCDREFVLDLDTIAEVNHFVFQLTFDGDDLRIIVDEVTGELKGLPIRARRIPAFAESQGPRSQTTTRSPSVLFAIWQRVVASVY